MYGAVYSPYMVQVQGTMPKVRRWRWDFIDAVAPERPTPANKKPA
jgi:hypothetical protein